MDVHGCLSQLLNLTKFCASASSVTLLPKVAWQTKLLYILDMNECRTVSLGHWFRAFSTLLKNGRYANCSQQLTQLYCL